jgi:tRNA(Ile)-lysidine synthase TilS/MesJ
MGVWIDRPFLEIDKEKIFKFSQKYFIPYLKNTTPEWSNRGKFRNHFLEAIYNQFGKEVDNKILSFYIIVLSNL